MTGKGINFNISGGNVNLGPVVQGDSNTVSSQSQIMETISERSLAAFVKEIGALSSSRGVSAGERDALLEEVRGVRDAMRREDKPSAPPIVKKIEELYDKYGWAVDVLRKLFVGF